MINTKIAISILHLNKPKLTVQCLESLKLQTIKDWHIYLLIQGAAREDKITLHNLYDDWDQITITENNNNTGFAEGNNINVRLALENNDTEYIVTLNNDTKVEPDFLAELIKPFKEERSDRSKNGRTARPIGMVQSKMMQMDKPAKIDNLGIELMKSGITFNIKQTNKTMFCPSAGAACYSRELLEAIRHEKQISTGFESSIIYDYFDSNFFAYAEDLDLGFRALHAGFKPLLAEKAICYHVGSASTGIMSDFAIQNTYRNIVWTLYKNLPLTLFIKYIFHIIIGYKLLWLNFLKKRKAMLWQKTLWDGIKTRKQFTNKRKQIISDSKITSSELEQYITKEIIDKDYL